jgi:oxygen-independent coproporphyrinogen III oxidase
MGKRDKDPLGLYIHIPFCHARCGYCDFVTFTGKDDQRRSYIEALIREVERYAGREIATVFLGGGTPSVLEPDHLQSLFASLHQHFRLSPSAEITLEANPESVTSEKLSAWKAAGINRLSIGLQAYDDALLKAMGRLHTVRQFEEAYAAARRAGFSNLNIDLIYGFSGQTQDAWTQTLNAAIALEPDHLSLYALTIEERTPFGAQGMEVDADLQAAMYAGARSRLLNKGYAQYEISNFSKPGKECRHNLIYWRGQDYLGLGVGAVGCAGGTRWENHKNLGPYYKDIRAGRLPRSSEEVLDGPTRKFERLMLGLRLREGFSWAMEEDPAWLAQRSLLASQGRLEEIRPDVWRIPDPYVPLTNQILLPFLSAKT